ncbi:ABC transporter substrate-binding protein [Bailinhaonella thermotolerans]|uniref:ABC transporter substrate-binding protein n=1 Tax=Bailinhaonella thermotolerans TaxID=1070861 RepID=A0A3A4ATQ9_9ACTN|nr:ABC transporter substrate-binding protein [Bailinhaonella thermotolerans]RJL31685.1 ABC transporter substrate-binding protein [Bailinhaonella thermotolerans]
MRLGRAGLVALTLALSLTATACGGGSDSAKSGDNPKGLEKTNLNIGLVPVPDSAAAVIADQKGFFKEEGLTVKFTPIPVSGAATPLMQNGSMDFALLNYVSTFMTQGQGAVKFKFVSDAYQGVPKGFALLAKKDSKIQTAKDLKGKKVAVPAPQSITHLLAQSAAQADGIGKDDFEAVKVGLPEMIGQLDKGTVDAIAAVEPFITEAQKKIGARIVADLVSGPTADFPVAGWGGLASFVDKNPKTVAAFQRALAKALKVAQDRQEVVKVIPSYTTIKADTVSIIALGTYPTTLEPARLQRVADMLDQFGYLKNKLDVQQMMAPQPK